MATKSLVFELLARGQDKVSAALEDVGGTSTRMGIAAGVAGGVAAAGLNLIVDAAAEAGRAVKDYLTEAIDNASSLNEAGTAIASIFGGDGYADLTEWAKGTAKSIGQSQLQALKASQTFGIFGKAAGLAGSDLSDFAKTNVKMASDFASFYDSTPEEAIEAIGAAFRGEMEPIRKYGILIDDAALKQKALEMGIYDGNDSLNAQQKTLAAQALIMEQGSVALGDFEKTSGGLANQQRILAAALEDTSTKIGTAFLPIAQEAVAYFVNDLVPGIESFADALLPKLEELGKSEALAELKENLAEIDWVGIGTNVGEAAQNLVDFANSVADINDAFNGSLSPESIESYENAWVHGAAQLHAFWTAFNGENEKETSSDPWENGALQINYFFDEILGPKLENGGQQLLDFSTDTNTSMMDFIAAWVHGADQLSDFSRDTQKFVGEAGVNIANFAGGVPNVIAIAGDAFDANARRVGQWGATVALEVTTIPGRISGAIGSLAAKGAAIGGDFISGFIGGIRDGIGGLAAAAASAADRAVKAAKEALNIHSPSRVAHDELGGNFTDGWAGGIDDGASDVESAINRVAALRPSGDYGANSGSSSAGGTPSFRFTSVLGSESLRDLIKLEIETASGWRRIDLENGSTA